MTKRRRFFKSLSPFLAEYSRPAAYHFRARSSTVTFGLLHRQPLVASFPAESLHPVRQFVVDLQSPPPPPSCLRARRFLRHNSTRTVSCPFILASSSFMIKTQRRGKPGARYGELRLRIAFMKVRPIRIGCSRATRSGLHQRGLPSVGLQTFERDESAGALDTRAVRAAASGRSRRRTSPASGRLEANNFRLAQNAPRVRRVDHWLRHRLRALHLEALET